VIVTGCRWNKVQLGVVGVVGIKYNWAWIHLFSALLTWFGAIRLKSILCIIPSSVSNPCYMPKFESQHSRKVIVENVLIFFSLYGQGTRK
jgi:hypothetical protein